MSYMKQQWLEREQLRAELEAEAELWRCKKSFRGDGAKMEQRGMANLSPAQFAPLVPGVDAGTVWACIIEIDLYKKYRPTCGGCGGTDWSNFSFREDKKVAKVTDVGETLVHCTICGWRGELQAVIHPTERPSLYLDVKNWLQHQAIITVTPPRGLKASIKDIDLIQHIRPSDQWSQSELDAFYGEPEKPKAEPTCEADKPEGTRDVDKFLKEQQEKLWRGD